MLTATHYYFWGLDLSGNLHGAGGVGGLLGVETASGQMELPTYDGNGNVMGLVDYSTGQVTATYEYSPFGELLRESGTDALLNPVRFSSKYTDDETKNIYFGHRYYNPSLGRFLGRDSTGELGGLNLFAFIGNMPVNGYDALGDDPTAVIGGQTYVVTPIPSQIFVASNLPPGTLFTSNPAVWGLSFSAFFDGDEAGVIIDPLDFVYVATPVKSAPTSTSTPPPSNPPLPVEPGSDTKPGNVPGNLADLEDDVVAAAIVQEVAFPNSPAYVSLQNTEEAMDAIASELYNRMNKIPSGFTQRGIDGGVANPTYYDLVTAGHPRQFAGFYVNSAGTPTESQSIQNNLAGLFSVANTGPANSFSTLINYAYNLANNLIWDEDNPNNQVPAPTDPFASKGGTYSNRTAGSSSPGGNYYYLGTLGGNDFYGIRSLTKEQRFERLRPKPKALDIE